LRQLANLSQNEISGLITKIYSASSDISKWKNVIDQLHGIFPSGPTVLYGHDAIADKYLGMVHGGLSEDDVKNFALHYAQISPFTKPISKVSVGTPRRVFDMCQKHTLHTSEYFNDFMLRRKGGGGAAIVLFRQESRSLILTTECDSRLSETTEPQITATMSLLSKHMTQSFDMLRRLSGRTLNRDNIGRMINLIGDAAFVLDSKRRVLSMNDGATALLADKKTVKTIGSELHFVESAAQQHFAKSCSDIEANRLDDLRSAYLLRDHYGRRLISVCPLAREVGFEDNMIFQVVSETQPFVVVVVSHVDNQSNLQKTILNSQFGLTVAESKLAEALASGIDLKNYADINGTSIHTVRNQLKNIFSKTDTSRQVELAILMNRVSRSSGFKG
jgi:DNA-binding CsgD family transcriptional regulator